MEDYKYTKLCDLCNKNILYCYKQKNIKSIYQTSYITKENEQIELCSNCEKHYFITNNKTHFTLPYDTRHCNLYPLTAMYKNYTHNIKKK